MNKKIHYAWYVMAAAFMMNLCVIGVASVGISIFLPALREKLNLTGTQSSFIMSLQGIATIAACRLPRYLTKPRQRRSKWDMAGNDGISRVSAVFRGKPLLTNKMRII